MYVFNVIQYFSFIIKQYLKNFCLLLAFLLTSHQAFSSNGQDFDGINYINPANNLFVNKIRVALGTVVVNPKIKFRGAINNNLKDSLSNPYIVSPYGRIIYRVNPDIALGLAVVEPFRAVIKFDLLKQGITGLNDDENIRSFTINPNLGIKIFEHFWLGAGLDITNFRVNENIVVPFVISPEPEVVGFRGRDVGISGTIGFIYLFNEATFIDVALFGQNIGQLKGFSSFKGEVIPTRHPSTLQIPDTLLLALTRTFWNEKLLLRAGLWHTYWKNFKASSLDLPLDTIIIPQNYMNTNRLIGLARYQLTDNYALSVFAAQDYTPTSSAETNFALAGDIFSAGFSLTKKINANLNVTALFGYGFNTSSVNINENRLITFGNIKNRIGFTNLQVTYNLDS